MTYCIGIKINTGLVFCSDSRTNAGPDKVNIYSKLHRFSAIGKHHVIIETAGNLATSQAVIAQVERDLNDDAKFNISKAKYISEIADYIGQLSLREKNKHNPAGPSAGFNAEATFIVGGQIKGAKTELYMVYSEGNHIKAPEQHPFLQIGEIKYGKPILDRIIRPETSHEIAIRCALVSMDSTIRSNATVGPPIELVYYQEDSLSNPEKYYRFEENDPYLIALREGWNENIHIAINALPAVDQLFEDAL